MATFGELSTRIQGDVGGRTANDLKTVVDRALNRAIEHYEQERFSFNVTRDTSLSSSINGTEYTLPASILNVLHVQFLSQGDLDYLEKWTYERYLKEITDDTNLVGEPGYYAVFGRELFIYPAPFEVAPFTISGVQRLTIVDDNTDNAWTNEGAPLIEARAKWDIYTNNIKNAAMATIQQGEVTYYLRKLKADMVRLESVGRIPVTEQF